MLIEEGAFLGMRTLAPPGGAGLGNLRLEAAAFLWLFAAAFGCFSIAAWRILASSRGQQFSLRAALWLIGVPGLLFRLTLLPLTPTLSDDIYRYLWDGRVQLAGINPYAHPPSAPELAPLRTGDFTSINHKDIPTVYPPLTQLTFRLAAAAQPTLFAQKLMFVAWDVLLMLLLLTALPRWGISRAWALIYAWHPLVIVEVAGSGHNDVLGIFWLVLGCWLWTFESRSARRGAAVAWGLCFLSKFVSALLIPWLLLRRDGRRALGWFALTVIVGYLPFLPSALQPGNGFYHYSTSWEFNSFGYALLHSVVAQPAVVRTLLLLLLVGWCLLMAKRVEDLPAYLLSVMGAAVLLGPVIEPWYLVWLVPFLVLRPRWPWLAFTGLVALSYAVLIGYVHNGVWQIPLWVKVAEYGGLVGLLAWERMRVAAASRGAAPGGAACAPHRGALRLCGPTLARPDSSAVGAPWPLGAHTARPDAARRGSAAGHPLAPRPTHVSVIIPALNEEEGINAVLQEIPRDVVHEIIVVDNGSTDRTAEAARVGGARVISEPRRGYGQACLTGIAALAPETDVVVFLDADHSDYPEEIPHVLAPIVRGEADFVIGSRVLGGAPRNSLTPQQRAGNWLACRLIAWRWPRPSVEGRGFTDLGPFRAIRRETLEALQMEDRAFGWTVEMQLKAVQRGVRVVEVPVRYRPRIGRSKISGTLLGSLRAGVAILGLIGRYSVTKNLHAPPHRPLKNMVCLPRHPLGGGGMRTWKALIISMGFLWAMATPALAEEAPHISQLPKDLAHLATAWVALPQTMYDVSREEGPVLGLTLGTVEGSSLMVEDTITYLTNGYHDPARANERRPVGALLHYSF